MAANEIRIGDVGTVLRATIKDGSSVIDISTVATKKLFFRKPDGKTFEVAAVFTGDGSDGQMQYTTVSGDLDRAGIWQMQGRITWAGGNQWTSDVTDFEVFPNLR